MKVSRTLIGWQWMWLRHNRDDRSMVGPVLIKQVNSEKIFIKNCDSYSPYSLHLNGRLSHDQGRCGPRSMPATQNISNLLPIASALLLIHWFARTSRRGCSTLVCTGLETSSRYLRGCTYRRTFRWRRRGHWSRIAGRLGRHSWKTPTHGCSDLSAVREQRGQGELLVGGVVSGMY